MSHIQREPHQPRTRVNGRDMTVTLLKTLRHFEASLEELTPAEAMLRACEACGIQPAAVVECMRHGCHNEVTWTGTAGRPKMFCGDDCRQKHERTRQRLTAEIEAIEAAMKHSATTRSQERELIRERSKRTYELARYPDVRMPRTDSPYRAAQSGG